MRSTDRAENAAHGRRRELRRFGWVLAAGFAALGGLALWRGLAAAPYFLALAAALVILALAVPSVLSPVERVWKAVALVLGVVSTYVMLTVVFVVAVTPVGLLMRAFGADPLLRRRARARSSYWTQAEASSRFDRPY